MAAPPERGRGATVSPPIRFEKQHYEAMPEDLDQLDPAEEDAVGQVRRKTQFLRDPARSIIAHNDSPDVGFGTSVNPYRGCEHGCSYCVSGETPILMADGTTRKLEDLRVGDEIYGTRRVGHYRRYVKTRVRAHWETSKPAYAVILADGTRLVASGDHRFLTERGWKFVVNRPRGQRPHLTLNNKLMGTGKFAPGPDFDLEDYRRGYLSGMIRGDGHLQTYDYERVGRSRSTVYSFRLALIDKEALDRVQHYLADFGVSSQTRVFQQAVGQRQQMDSVSARSRSSFDGIKALVAWPADPSELWRRGFLAGMFDAEGSFSSGVLRICNTDPEIIDKITECLVRFGLGFAMEERQGTNRPVRVVRITGGLPAHFRFFHTVGNAIARKRNIEGVAIKSNAALEVLAIEPLGTMKLFDITTGTGDFIADGVVSHNCFARPTHEYLGFSAGLDFESKIMVKEDAPALLRAELTSPKWTPQTIVMSGVTDCYQPVERKLGLTRRCLEVLAEFRNPVAIITKNHLVTRDADVLGELARFDAATVYLSITTLDETMARTMEPRAATPQRRLDAVRELTAAGVPVGVMVAPIVPGLTDHEMPAILAAAAAAGAVGAGYTIVRLPWAVAPIFEAWLDAHFPDRKEKVLGRLRAMRDGKLNDPRWFFRARGEGPFAQQIDELFKIASRRAGLPKRKVELSTAHFRRPAPPQMSLF